MPTKLQVPVRNTLTVEKAKKLLEFVKRKVSDGDINEPGQMLAYIFNSFRELFSALSTPITGKLQLRKDDFRSAKEYSDFLTSLASDLDVLLSSTQAVTNAAVESFNLAQIKAQAIRTKIAQVTSYSSDLQLLDNNLGTNNIVAGDDFSDDSRIDMQFPVSGARAEMMPGGFGVSLRKTGSESVIDQDKVKIDVDANKRTYEGRYYAPLGQAEPEGGEFHWQEVGKAAKTEKAVESASKEGQTSLLAKGGLGNTPPLQPAHRIPKGGS